MSKQNIEVEDDELAIRNSKGDIAIIPKKDRNEILKLISGNNHKLIDLYVKFLPKMSRYAENGTLVSSGDEPKIEALRLAYNIATSNGYRKSLDEFSTLLSSNQDALKMSYDLAKKNGYKKSLDEYSILLGVKKKDEEFVSDGQSTLSNQAEAVKKSRVAAMKNDDGSVSTVKMMSYEQDGKYYAAPTLFPKDPNKQTEDPADWIELQGEEAIKEAERRGEVYQFNTDEEAKAFAEGGWKQPEKKEPNLLESTGAHFLRGAYDLLGTVEYLKTKALEEIGLPGVSSSGVPMTSQTVELMKQKADADMAEHMKVREQGFFEAIGNGNIGDALGIALETTAESLPLMATAAIGGGGVATYALISSIAAGQTYLDVKNEDWFKDLSTWGQLGYVSAMGAFESVGEVAGGKIMSRSIKELIKSGNKEVIKKSLGEVVTGYLKATGKSFTEEGIGEAITQLGQDITDAIARGEDVDIKKILYNTLEAGVLGGISGAGMSGTIGGISSSIDAVNVVNRMNSVKRGDYEKVMDEYSKAAENGATPDELAFMQKRLVESVKNKNEADKQKIAMVSEMTTESQTELYNLLGEVNSMTGEIKKATTTQFKDELKSRQAEKIERINNIIDEATGRSVYKIDGNRFSKEAFLSRVEKMTPEQLMNVRFDIVNDKETTDKIANVINEKKQKENAVQEPTTKEGVLRQERPEMGLSKVGEGNTQEQETSKASEEVVRKEGEVTPDVAAELTEDNDGNYIFHHYSGEKRETIKPMSGENPITSREEASAMSSVGGVALYYTKGGQKETGVGDVQHTVRIPKEKVLLFNSLSKDSEIFKEAESRFRAKFPNLAFTPNHQVAWVTKVAGEMGYDMVLSKWGNGFRAQTTKELTPDKSNTSMKPATQTNFKIGDELEYGGERIQITEDHGDTVSYRSTEGNTTGTISKRILSIRGNRVYDFDKQQSKTQANEKQVQQSERQNQSDLIINTLRENENIKTEYPTNAPKYNWKGLFEIINSISPKPNKTISFYHGGLPVGTDIKNIDVFKLAEKQQKKGADFSGFYMYGESQISKADDYGQGTKNKSLHRIDIRDDAKVLELENTDRIKKTDLELYKSQGYDLIRGRDVRGREEYILLNNDVIVGFDEISKYKSPQSIFEAYQKAKADGSNPELVSKVEQFLKEKADEKQVQQAEGQNQEVAFEEDENQTSNLRDEKWDEAKKKSLPASQFESVDELEKTLNTEKFGMLTGENPLEEKSAPKTNAENRALNVKAREWLIEKGYSPDDIFGKYGDSESSFFVKGLSKKHALEFMEEFNQQSVALEDMILYKNGTYRPRTGAKVGNTGVSDMYSTVNVNGKNVNVEISYDFDLKDAKEPNAEIATALREISEEKNLSEIGTGTSPSEVKGYDRMMKQIKGIISKSERRGVPYNKVFSNAMSYLKGSKVYERASDVQREQMVRDLNKQFGRKLKSAPLAKRLLGQIANIKKITIDEAYALKNQIMSEARGAKNAIAARKAISSQIINELKGYVNSGKISQRQLLSIANKIATMNVFDDAKVNELIEHMKNVFAISEYNAKVKELDSKSKRALGAINKKLGIASELVPLLQKVFSLKASKVPSDVFDKYEALVNMMSERKAVLSVKEVNEMVSDAKEIMSSVLDKAHKVDELKDRISEYENKVLDENGKLKYGETLKAMLADEVISIEEYELMKSEKNIINPPEREKMSDEDIAKEKEYLVSQVKKSSINSSRLPSLAERKLSRELERLMKTGVVEKLGNDELKSLIRLIDSINNGIMPHYAQLMADKLTKFKEAKVLASSVESAMLSGLENKYTAIKTMFMKNKNRFLAAMARNPLYFIDQVFKDYNTKRIYNSLFKPIAEGYAIYRSEFNTMEAKIGDAVNKLSKSLKANNNKLVKSKYRITAYMVQLEYESNPGNKEVNKAADFLRATIDAFNKKPGSVNYSQKDIDAFQEILSEFDKDGNIDLAKMYDSFSKEEQNLIKAIQDMNRSLSERAEYTGAVIRGTRINPRSNYVHLKTVGGLGSTDMDMNESLVQKFMRISRPSTKAESLIERTGKVHPIDFDIVSTALAGAREILIDYNMTVPVRRSQMAVKAIYGEFESLDKKSAQVIDALEQGLNNALKGVLSSSFMNQSFADRVIVEINKAGYRAMLGSTTRASAEFISNLGFAIIKDRKAFAAGMKYGGLMTKDGFSIMQNIGSSQTTRLFPTSSINGRMVDMEMLGNIHGANSSTMNSDVYNVMQIVYNYTLKRGLKNPATFIADTLISTPDKIVARPMWFGTFANKFKELTGEEVDFNKISQNDEQYMLSNKDAIDVSKEYADNASILTSASDNPFMGILKNNIDQHDSTLLKTFKMFNGFMNRFMIYEYTTARTGIHALMNNDIISKEEGARLVAAASVRMTVYMVLSKVLATGLAGLILGSDDDDEQKSFAQTVGQAVGSTATSLIVGRNFGNMNRGLMSLPVEYMNKEYLDFLREGDYNVYKDALSYNTLPISKKPGDNMMWETVKNMSGAYSPFIETLDRSLEVAMKTPKTQEAIDRRKKELMTRTPFEILGVSGMVPLYTDARKILMKYLYKDITSSDKGGMSESEFRKNYPQDYKQLYKEYSNDAQLRKMNELINENKRKMKELEEQMKRGAR